MAAMNLISDLKPFKSMWKVKVKIIRLWNQYSAAGGETIEIVFVDARGDKIHGTVKKEEVGQFRDLLKQGQTKVLINFTVTNTGGSYRSTKHLYKVVFLPTTRVRICEVLPNNLTGMDPVNYRDVLDGTLNDDFLVDVIGQIVEVSHMEAVSVNGKDTHKITLELRNHKDERLPLVLWGKFAEEISNAVQMEEERSISNAYNVSDVALNPHMDEVEAFMRLLPKDDLSLTIVEPKPLALVSGVSERDDFFVRTPRKTIAEVLESKHVGNCIVMASIAAIDSDMGWYYLSCKVCAKKVWTVPNDTIDDEDKDYIETVKYYCPKYKTYSPKLLPRYNLHVVVLDNTANCKLLMFDNLAQQLLHRPCIELTGPINNEDPDEVPPSLTDLVGKTFLFKIGIEKENFTYKQDTFKVLKIVTNLVMINEFDSTDSAMGSENTFGGSFSALSDAPEGSLMCNGGSSCKSESSDFTPAKRIGTPIITLDDTVDQNSVTRVACSKKVKKEKNEFSG
ncbi:uncharacterized protein LOC108821854 [Raphanus sativus]|uniref:Uncharacterized protein LOC108821854 n=1 Tax=Raphanus sativus TaxID=3726 RepID=A0A9W3D876_RAPSA|nr:uncharacterized protein LOC108821854 [Raphanus sativus]